MRVPDILLNSAVFLSYDYIESGITKRDRSSTAFLVSVPATLPLLSHVQHNYLVTAAHLVKDKPVSTTYYAELPMGDGERVRTQMGAQIGWHFHPEPATMQNTSDVAVLPLTTLSLDHISSFILPISLFLTDEVIQRPHPQGHGNLIGIGDEVFMIGRFSPPHSVTAPDDPILRMGTVSMMEGKLRSRAYIMDGYLVELHSLTGMSGAPVFVRETLPDGKGSFYLMGLMHAHYSSTLRDIDDIVFDFDEQRTKAQKTERTGADPINIGIAIVVPANKILETLNQPTLVEMRLQCEQELLQAGAPVFDDTE